MIDRLKEMVDRATVQVEHGMPLMPSVAHDLLAAARLLVAGQPLWWCETHQKFYFMTIGRSRACRMVEGVWVLTGKDET